MAEFGNRLREARLKKGLNQKELADAMGLTQASISQFEKGQRLPTPANITKLSEILEVPRDFLAGEDKGEFEKTLLMRNIKELTPEAIKEINKYVDLIKSRERLKSLENQKLGENNHDV